MAASSPRDAALGNIISLVTIACVSGLFFMQGVVNAVRGERLLTWLFFLCMPYFALCISHSQPQAIERCALTVPPTPPTRKQVIGGQVSGQARR